MSCPPLLMPSACMTHRVLACSTSWSRAASTNESTSASYAKPMRRAASTRACLTGDREGQRVAQCVQRTAADGAQAMLEFVQSHERKLVEVRHTLIAQPIIGSKWDLVTPAANGTRDGHRQQRVQVAAHRVASEDDDWPLFVQVRKPHLAAQRNGAVTGEGRRMLSSSPCRHRPAVDEAVEPARLLQPWAE